jgi:hypothetical protein
MKLSQLAFNATETRYPEVPKGWGSKVGEQIG